MAAVGSVLDRFWDNVDMSGGPDACWPWARSRRGKGYGSVKVNGRLRSAHRVAYRLATGHDPVGLLVMHVCDNPPCCNPAHLSAGTASDNMRDMVAKHRGGGFLAAEGHNRGEKHATSKLTNADVAAIRAASTGEWGERTRFARDYGVTVGHICEILNGKKRRHG